MNILKDLLDIHEPKLCSIQIIRQRALQWWKELGDDIGEMADKYNRGCETIQEHQIEEIYLKEAGHVA